MPAPAITERDFSSTAPVPQEPVSLFSRDRSEPLRRHAPALILIAGAIVIMYWWGIWVPVLGPELALFYSVAHDRSFSHMLSEYVNFGGVLWYRPTAFYLPYWIGEHFLSWHNTVGWKFFQVAVLIPACWATYGLTQVLFRGQRLAGVIAALYLASHPGVISVVMQNAAFDATHIFFVLLTVVLFCYAQAFSGTKAWMFNTLALLCFIGALTSKELTVVVPVYLSCISVLVIIFGPNRSFRRQVLLLLPFFLLLGAYYFLHVRRMPTYEATGDYRTGFNATVVRENATKFPFWVVRMFGVVRDSSNQNGGHVHSRNNVIALGLAVLTLAYWIPEILRRREMRFKALMLLLWVAVFLSVPIYSGRYLWHGDLAVCGYAILCGVAVASWIHRMETRRMRQVMTTVTIAAFVGAGIASSADNVLRGVYAIHYRVGAKLLQKLPVPASQMPPNALVFVEDRLGLSPWSYGGQALFRYAYLKADLREKAVPAMDKVPIELSAQWLKEPHAFFFRYDDDFNWFDATAEFRAAQKGKLTHE